MTAVCNEKLLNLLEQLNTCEDKVCEDRLVSAINEVIAACRVPPLREPDVPHAPSDFEGVAENAEVQLCVVLRILDVICSAKERGQRFTPLFMRNCVVSCFLVASEYIDGTWEWSSRKTADRSESVMGKLCEVCGCESVREILAGVPDDSVDDGSPESIGEIGKRTLYLKLVLQMLSEIFNKKNWKMYPALKMSYFWILQKLDRVQLGEQMAYLLPPALFIVDDWEQRNKVLGLKCLHYIIRNTTGSELRWYGRAAVIYDALKNLLYLREGEVLEVLYPAITEVAVILESDPSNTYKLKSESCYDVILHQLLLDMGHEQKLLLRSVYAASLLPVLSAMGTLAVRWSKELIDVCEGYLATPDGPTGADRINILKALQLYVRECWQQVHLHAASIVKMIMRLLYDVTDAEADLSSEVVDALSQEAVSLLKLVHAAAPNTTREFCRGLESILVPPQFQLLLKEMLTIISTDE